LRYRGLDEVTDVLAFSSVYDAEESRGYSRDRDGERFYTGGKGYETLGEIIISYPQMRRQSKKHATQSKDELALLVVHGILHLLGYDHDTPGREGVMWALQDAVLNTRISCESF
jgi:probable rRNA maturation factor